MDDETNGFWLGVVAGMCLEDHDGVRNRRWDALSALIAILLVVILYWTLGI